MGAWRALDGLQLGPSQLGGTTSAIIKAALLLLNVSHVCAWQVVPAGTELSSTLPAEGEDNGHARELKGENYDWCAKYPDSTAMILNLCFLRILPFQRTSTCDFGPGDRCTSSDQQLVRASFQQSPINVACCSMICFLVAAVAGAHSMMPTAACLVPG